jgi:hypothetical protein
MVKGTTWAVSLTSVELLEGGGVKTFSALALPDE